MSTIVKSQTVKDFTEETISQLKFRIVIAFTVLVIPMSVGLMYWIEISSMKQTLMPISSQMAQSFALGDELTLNRLANTLVFSPGIESVKVFSKEGVCTAYSYKKTSSLSSSVQDPCFYKPNFFTFKIIQSIDGQGVGALGSLHVNFWPQWRYLLLIPILLLAGLFLIRLIFQKIIEGVLAKLVSMIELFPNRVKSNDVPGFSLKEVDQVFSEIRRMRDIEINDVALESFRQTARQVSHDIRSPLAALEMLVPSLNEIPEDRRVVIRNSIGRIRDIANTLLAKKSLNDKLSTHQDDVSFIGLEIYDLSSLIDSIVTEKRLQFRNTLGAQIEFNHSTESYGLFAKVSSNEFKRAISNLVNNSVEALKNGVGVVKLELKKNDDEILIKINDNGIGVPLDVIPTLGVKGRTYGKPEGYGLGLHYAKNVVEEWGGELNIQSAVDEEKHGTTVSISLPEATTPQWFVKKIHLSPKHSVIVFDDDQTIHQIWSVRLEKIKKIFPNISIKHISSIQDFRNFYSANFFELDEVLFLMDLEIAGKPETGLDLIEQFGIMSNSILVTSRYEEPEIRRKCDILGIKLIPKPLSGFVPIEVEL